MLSNNTRLELSIVAAVLLLLALGVWQAGTADRVLQ